MYLRNPQGRIVNLPDGIGKYYASLPDWELAQKPETKQVEPTAPKHVGAGYYELSNGERVKGKDNAIKAQQAL
jgi:hypothetical protein